MNNKVFRIKQRFSFFVCAMVFSVLAIGGCAVEAAKSVDSSGKSAVLNKKVATGATIQINPGSPADTVRVFYQKMRERKFREALFLTNLRPAIEGLSDDELKELQVDFDVLAGQIPAEIAINGEIIMQDKATVTANLPDDETDQMSIQEINLRRENGVWIILTLDEEAEQVVKKEGSNYFFALKNETHQEEAKGMLERIFKAQLVYSMQNGGRYGELQALIELQLLPEDIRTSESTGYNYSITLTDDKTSYTASAVPANYGKTGTLSFLLSVDKNQKSSVKSADIQGKPLKK